MGLSWIHIFYDSRSTVSAIHTRENSTHVDILVHGNIQYMRRKSIKRLLLSIKRFNRYRQKACIAAYTKLHSILFWTPTIIRSSFTSPLIWQGSSSSVTSGTLLWSHLLCHIPYFVHMLFYFMLYFLCCAKQCHAVLRLYVFCPLLCSIGVLLFFYVSIHTGASIPLAKDAYCIFPHISAKFINSYIFVLFHFLASPT